MKKALLLLTALLTIAHTATTQDKQTGFLHPGGLHTQDDFQRVKAQLAADNQKVTAAYNILKTAPYAQPNTQSNPVQTIVRGGNGENYINAARAATIAFQNALRWKIENNQACAQKEPSYHYEGSTQTNIHVEKPLT